MSIFGGHYPEDEHVATPRESMSEYAFNTSDPDPDLCRCHGRGWILTGFDVAVECPCHYNGQTHPEEECYE